MWWTQRYLRCHSKDSQKPPTPKYVHLLLHFSEENIDGATILHVFFKNQEYEEALKKLRNAYYSNVTNSDVIKRTNADLLSDAFFNYKKIEATAFQANANQKATSEIERKNTFLFR